MHDTNSFIFIFPGSPSEGASEVAEDSGFAVPCNLLPKWDQSECNSSIGISFPSPQVQYLCCQGFVDLLV